MSADEIATQEKAEKELAREEQLNSLMRENTVNKYAKSFVLLGYPEEKANEAATAQYDNDFETLTKLQKEHQEEILKKKEAEWLKSRPTIASGVGDEKPSYTKEQFDRLGYSARVAFKQKYPQTYEAYTK